MRDSVRKFCASVTTLIGAMVLLSACATDAQRTRTEGATMGATIGAVAGQLLGGNREGALAGAVLGGVIGGIFGDQTADKKARYAAQEDELRASADRASTLAQVSRDRNEQLDRDIAALEQSVQQLRTAKLSAESKRALAEASRKQHDGLMTSIDEQLRALREEISRQQALAKAATLPPKPDGTSQPVSEGIRLVSAGMRDLDQQTRALEIAKLNLQKIDRRRAY